MKGTLDGLREAVRVAGAEKEKGLKEVAGMKEKSEKESEVGGRRVGL